MGASTFNADAHIERRELRVARSRISQGPESPELILPSDQMIDAQRTCVAIVAVAGSLGRRDDLRPRCRSTHAKSVIRVDFRELTRVDGFTRFALSPRKDSTYWVVRTGPPGEHVARLAPSVRTWADADAKF